ncbi:MAG: DNA cytosine methyltransferase [Alphaproteobacteria bacterium]|nr:DNA cytosine methyltransferase [Alphaproteobacteria bacterium]
MTFLFPPTAPIAQRGHEIIVDSFAGGGGASTGIFLALGRHPDVAVNHDPEAVAMHTANHPTTDHFCQNVWQVDPAEVAAKGPIGLAWFSPDCKHFSKAKGGKPVEKRIRDLAWVVVAYARLPRHLRPRVIILENVEEFTTWGPLAADGRPCPDRKGQEFVRWIAELRRLGYRIEYRELRACDYGAPTIRKRLFLIARCDGAAIVWPEPTHGGPDTPEVLSGQRRPWRTAADIIDWSIPCPSIFLTKDEARAIGVKRPLEEATLRRIFRGLDRYVLNHPRPFIVPVTHAGDDRCHDSAEPLRTITTAKRGELSLVMPYLAGCGGRAGQSPERGADQPIWTMTAKADQILCTPFVTKFRHGSTGHQADEPLHTITASHSDYHPGGAAPLGVVMPYFQTYYGAKRDDEVRGAPADGLLGTQTTENRHAIITPWMVQQNTGVVGHEVTAPVSTIMHTGSHQMLAAAHLTQFHGSNQGNGGDPAQPLGAVLAQGFHHAEVRAFLVKYYGSAEDGQHPGQPLHTATAKARFGLVTVAGEDFAIVDIGMRMLSPRELFRAQGFPDDYVIDLELDGRRLPKSSQVRMCGNSVCPPIAAALVRANVPELTARPAAALTAI